MTGPGNILPPAVRREAPFQPDAAVFPNILARWACSTLKSVQRFEPMSVVRLSVPAILRVKQC